MAQQDDWQAVGSGQDDWAPVAGGAAPATPAVPPDWSDVTQVRAAPPQVSGFLRYPLMAGSELLRGIDIGAGIPGDIEAAVRGGVSRVWPGAPALDPFGTGTLLPTSSTLLNATGAAGLTQNPALEPGWGANPETERLLAAGASGAGAALPLAVAGPEALPAKLATMAGTGAAGGVAAEGTRALLPNAPAAVPLAAGMAAGGLGQAGLSLLAKGSVGAIAKGLGDSETFQDSGEALQDAARDWRTVKMPQLESEAWAPVDAKIPPDTQVMLSNFAGALSTINKRAGGLQPVADVLSKALPRRLQDALGIVEKEDRGVPMQTNLGLASQTQWSDARTIRSMLGEALSDPKMTSDIGEQNLKFLYRSITQDLGNTARLAGAGDEFDSANAASTQLHDFAEGPLSRVIAGPKASSADPKPEDVAARLLSGGRRGGSDISALRAAIPDAVDELAAAHLRVNPQAWTKLSPEAKASLVPDAGLRQQLDRLIPAVPASKDTAGVHALQSIAGAHAGGALGALSEFVFGPGTAASEIGGTAAGELLGQALPYAYRGAVSVARNPSMLALPAAGGVGATPNALYPWAPLPTPNP